jgi:hypothetical protein
MELRILYRLRLTSLERAHPSNSHQIAIAQFHFEEQYRKIRCQHTGYKSFDPVLSRKLGIRLLGQATSVYNLLEAM